jgi:hypothetical protein
MSDEGFTDAAHGHAAGAVLSQRDRQVLRRLVVVQREGTVEELGAALEQAGAADGIILDNGGSVACWVWWANAYAGGLVSPTVDHRPPGTSAIAFVLKGPSNVTLPGGSVAFSVA